MRASKLHWSECASDGQGGFVWGGVQMDRVEGKLVLS